VCVCCNDASLSSSTILIVFTFICLYTVHPFQLLHYILLITFHYIIHYSNPGWLLAIYRIKKNFTLPTKDSSTRSNTSRKYRSEHSSKLVPIVLLWHWHFVTISLVQLDSA
jgi:hypothetical protein